jgi:hypothetical protein
LKKYDKELLIRSSQDDVLTIESHPPPSRQYTKIIQEVIDLKGGDDKQGDLVLEWDTKKGQPDTRKESERLWLGPYKIVKKSVNDSYYLSTLQMRRRPLPISGSLLKPHHGEEI